MPITITTPQPAGVLSPGLSVQWVSDFVGPLATGSHVNLELFQPTTNEVTFWTARLQTDQVFGNLPILVENTPASTTLSGQPKDGDSTKAVVVLTDPAGIVLDQGSANFPWSTTAGLGTQAFIQAGASGGLTSQEHAWLDNVQQFIQNTAAFGGRLGLQVLAGGILEHPDVGLMHECDSPFDLVSGVDLTRPATGIGVNAFGLVLRVTVAPAGAGLRHGAVNEYQTRVAQLASIHRSASASSEYVTEILDLHGEQLAWLWQNAYPERISVDVTPGFTVQASWLCVTLPV